MTQAHVDKSSLHTSPSATQPAASLSTATPASQAEAESARRPANWRHRYARRLWLSDLFVLAWVAYGTQLLWFGWGNAQVAIREDSRLSVFSYWAFSTGLVVAWMWALSFIDSRDFRVIGTGTTEYVRVASSGFRLFGAIAILAFLLRVDVARGYLLIALPLGIFTLVFVRWVWRQWLIAQRSTGGYAAQVLLVGPRASVAQIAHELARSTNAGYQVVGACVPGGRLSETIAGTSIPILGGVNAVERALASTHADTVAITSTDELPPDKVKEISWMLEVGRQHLVLAPSIMDVAGPRLHTRPVAGLPLIHVETPSFSKGQRFIKRMMDLTLAIVGGAIISPLMLVLAIVVKLSSPGPVLFRQLRIGHRGREFEMLKFRSMVVGAEDMLDEVKSQQDSGNEVLFKMTNDPRTTAVGRFMRRFSLDELPQLLNVIAGSMSLVGPRPPLQDEVAHYADHVHRRFLMKPGITGSWQVGGRSSLSWDESVRLDLSYVENWSLLGDIVIILKTARAAVVPGDTAA